MGDRTFVILGGYGNAGRHIAELLLQETDVRLVLAGRNREKAHAMAAALNARFRGRRVSGTFADASKPQSLHEAFQGTDLVVVASSTAEYARNVASATIEASADYLDIQYSTRKVAELQLMSRQIEEAGRCFITEGGFHPGLPAALIRYAAQPFDRLETANVGSVIKIDWTSLDVGPSTVDELLTEMMDFQSLVFRDGQWQEIGMLGMMKPLKMDFGGNFGRQSCVPMFLEEMHPIPEMYPMLKETGFFVGGFNWFVDWLVIPIALVALRVWPQQARTPTARLMEWGLRAFSKPPYGTLLKVEARGTKAGEAKALDVTISHKDGYLFTAIPVVACLLQYLDGSIKKPGLWLQANVVEPNRLIKDMERMGIQVHTRGDWSDVGALEIPPIDK